MIDLRDRLDSVWRAALRVPPASGARCLMFMAAREGEGTSSVAASFALKAAAHARKAAWLLDLDLRGNGAFEGFETGFAAGLYPPGRAYDASLRTEPIYSITLPEMKERPPGVARKLLTVHEIPGTRLLVSRFRNEALQPGQRVHLRDQPDWWAKVRKAADWIIMDAPALNRSPAGLTMAGEADGVILVVQADSTGPDEVAGLRMEVEAQGGRVIGVVLNQMGADARFADRLAG